MRLIVGRADGTGGVLMVEGTLGGWAGDKEVVKGLSINK